jgi:excisionase family DNA binding protein
MPELRSAVFRLRAGWEISDAEFDRIYPAWVRKLSKRHWTPIDVARRAAELLAVDSICRVLDIGSGAGKFCLVGALTTRATFVGIEQRRSLVDVARQTARSCGVSRAQFLHGNMMTLDWSEFDGFYLFNPFYEHIADFLTPIGEAIELSAERYAEYVTTTCMKLFSARIGARVVTYHGYGGLMPPGYRLILHEPAGSDYLEVWEKESLAETPSPDEDGWVGTATASGCKVPTADLRPRELRRSQLEQFNLWLEQVLAVGFPSPDAMTLATAPLDNVTTKADHRPPGEYPGLLTVRDAAKLLRTPEKQIYRWIDDGEIPFHKVNEQIRFHRAELLEWATARRLPISVDVCSGSRETDSSEVAPSESDDG